MTHDHSPQKIELLAPAGSLEAFFAAMEFGALGLPLVAIILVSSLMAVVYVWRIVEAACFAKPAAEPASGAGVSPALVAVLWLAAGANIAFGLAPGLPLALSAEAATELLDHLP